MATFNPNIDITKYTKDEINTLLDSKANTKHTHIVSDITDLDNTLSKYGSATDVANCKNALGIDNNGRATLLTLNGNIEIFQSGIPATIITGSNVSTDTLNAHDAHIKQDIAVYDGAFNNKVLYTLDEDNIDTVVHLHVNDIISGPFKWYRFSPRLDRMMMTYNQLSIYNTPQQNVTSSMVSNTYNPVFEIEFDNSTATTIERYLIMIVNEKEYKIQITANVADDSTININHGSTILLNYNEIYYNYVYTLPFNFYVKDKYIYIQFKNDVLYDKLGVKLMNYSGDETIYSRVIYNKTPISDCVYMDNNVIKAKNIIVSGTPIENLMMTFYAADVIDNLLESGHHYAFMVDKNVHTYDVDHLYMENRPNLWNTDMANYSDVIFWYYDSEHRLYKTQYSSKNYIARYNNSLELTINYGGSSLYKFVHIGFSSLGFLYDLDDPRYVFGYQQGTISVGDTHLKLYTLDHAKALVWSYYLDPTTSTSDDPSIFTSMYNTSSTTTSSFIANHNVENRSITNVSIYKQSASEPSVTYDSIQSFKCYNKLNDDLVLQNIISDVTSYITYEHSDNINVLGVMYANTKKWIINDDVADSYDKVEVIDANDNIIAEFVNDRSKANFGKISATVVDTDNILTDEIDVKHVYAEDTHTDIFTANEISFKPYKYSVIPAITFNNDYFVFEFNPTAKTFTFGVNTNADFSTTTTDELKINVWSSFYLGNNGSPEIDLQVIYNKSSNQCRAGRYSSESATPISNTTFNYNGVEGYWYTSDDCSKIIVYHPNYAFPITVESLSSDINSIKPTASLSTMPSSSINVNFNISLVQGNISIGEENISDASKRISISTDDTNSTIFKTPMLQTSAFQLASTPITATKLNADDPDSLNVYQFSRNGHKHDIGDVEGLSDTLNNVSLKGHTHKSSDITFDSNIIFTDSGTNTREIRFTTGTNDYARFAGGATGSNAGYLEIATADDASEPIYVRQYKGVFTGDPSRTLTLLDGSGNTSIPGNLSIGGATTVNGNITASNVKADNDTRLVAVESGLTTKPTIKEYETFDTMISDWNNIPNNSICVTPDGPEETGYKASFTYKYNLNRSLTFNIPKKEQDFIFTRFQGESDESNQWLKQPSNWRKIPVLTNEDNLIANNVKANNETRLVAVESGLTKKANTSHTHKSSDITFDSNIIFTDSGNNTREIRFVVGKDDCGRIAAGATGTSAGWMEIATADDVQEPIYVRQYRYYNGNYYHHVEHEAVLLDADGNTSFPKTLTATNVIATNVTADNETRLAAVESGLTTKANASHTHAIADVKGLENVLDNIQVDLTPVYTAIDNLKALM